MTGWIPRGYIHVTALVSKHGIDRVRNDLFSGRLKASKLDEAAGDLEEIEPMYWCSRDAGRWLAKGSIPHRSDEFPSRLIVVKVEDEPKPQPATDGVYLPPLMAMQQAAIQHFNITKDSCPGKKELVAHFCAQKLPDGRPISPNLAGHLATGIRPVEAMKGGMKKKV